MTPAEDDQRDHEVYVPATDDWPRGLGEASWWPIVTVTGIVVLFLGVSVYVLGRKQGISLDSGLGVPVAFLGLLVGAMGVIAWTYHGFVVRYWEQQGESSESKYLWAVLLFLVTELAVFGSGTLYFVVTYVELWPPIGLPVILNWVVWVMTGALLTSSLTVYFAGRELRKDNRRRFLLLLAATPLLGIVFLAGKAWNYYRLVVVEGVSIGSGFYWNAYFGLGGLHAVFTAVGVSMLLVVLARALAGQYSADRHVSLTTAGRYWWVVDTLWIILLTILYTSLKVSA